MASPSSRLNSIAGAQKTSGPPFAPAGFSNKRCSDGHESKGEHDMASPIAQEAIKVGLGEVGVKEEPPGSNRGPQVDEYLKASGNANPPGKKEGNQWCLSFVYWCFDQAAKTKGVNPMPKTGFCPYLYGWAK